MKSTIAAASLLATAATARQCKNLTIPIHAAARNGVFNYDAPVTNIDVTNFILNIGQQGSNYTEELLESYTTFSGDYEIAATYCQPDKGPSSVIQILTHGIGFDRSYWDVPFNDYNYSYVAEAVDHYGYSTFTWDRLGIGMSSLGDPVQEIQALLEVDALKELTLAIQGGKVDGIPNCFEKYTHAGHSFGAQHTYALTAMYPDISDGITLQGFSQNGSFLPFFLYGGNFIQANNIDALSKYPNGYMAPGNPSGVQTNFFSPGYFDPEILAFAASTGQPVTVGELLTIGGEVATMNNFAGPTHIVTGGRDVPYCGGDCYAAPTGFENIPSQSIPMLPNAQNLVVDISKSLHPVSLCAQPANSICSRRGGPWPQLGIRPPHYLRNDARLPRPERPRAEGGLLQWQRRWRQARRWLGRQERWWPWPRPWSLPRLVLWVDDEYTMRCG